MTEPASTTLNPSWVSILPLLLASYCDGVSGEGRGVAMAELRRIAELADLYGEAVRSGRIVHVTGR